jgi:hypothetical protein
MRLLSKKIVHGVRRYIFMIKFADVYKIARILTVIALAVIILLKVFKIVEISAETLILMIIGTIVVFTVKYINH